MPGGPARSRLWPPAAAISSARRALLTPHVRQVGDRLRRRPPVRGGLHDRRIALAAQVRDDLCEVPRRDRLHAGKRGFGRRVGGAQQPPEPRAPRSLRGRQRPSNRPNATVERELPERRVTRQPVDRELPRSRQDRERDRKVESGAFLPQPGRREVDGYPPRGPLELGRRDAAPHPVLRLLARPIRQADDRKARHAVLEVGLHLDLPRLQPDQGVRDGAPEHRSTLWVKDARVGNGSVPKPCLCDYRATRMSSKNSPALRPVRRFTWRRRRSSSRSPARSRISG